MTVDNGQLRIIGRGCSSCHANARLIELEGNNNAFSQDTLEAWAAMEAGVDRDDTPTANDDVGYQPQRQTAVAPTEGNDNDVVTLLQANVQPLLLFLLQWRHPAPTQRRRLPLAM
jgi:hypothetical protein